MQAQALTGTGIGLRHRHYRDFLDGRPQVDWLEIHSENYFGDGGRDLHVLQQVRADYSLSLHGVGLSLGSVTELAVQHLAKLKRLAERVEPTLISEHLCWGAYSCSAGAGHWNDLLPVPYTNEALDLFAARIDHVQETLGRRILVENISAYVEFDASQMGEMAFVNTLAKRTGCGVLLDLNNLYVNAVNHGFDAARELAALAPEHVGEIHLAGHFHGEDCLIDDHGARVADPVWALYESWVTCHGAAPTLIEWDTAVPALDVLLGEADQARRIAARAAPAVREAAHV
jgi:uncharacterized protein (UPF0276 family)